MAPRGPAEIVSQWQTWLRRARPDQPGAQEALPDQTHHEGKAAEERYLKSYPFHPDLTDIFYSKWTNLEGFQRTRGVLRTFALAFRDAARWVDCPLVGPNVFAGEPGGTGLAEAARELTTIAATKEYEGRRHEWGPDPGR